MKFLRAESISQLLAPLSGIFINSELYRRLQEMLKKLPLDGRPIHGNSFINMMMSTVTQPSNYETMKMCFLTLADLFKK